jgi:hypothetical protein
MSKEITQHDRGQRKCPDQIKVRAVVTNKQNSRPLNEKKHNSAQFLISMYLPSMLKLFIFHEYFLTC